MFGLYKYLTLLSLLFSDLKLCFIVKLLGPYEQAYHYYYYYYYYSYNVYISRMMEF